MCLALLIQGQTIQDARRPKEISAIHTTRKQETNEKNQRTATRIKQNRNKQKES